MYFPIASFLWTDCVAVFIWLLVTSRTKPRFSVFHAICWGIPAVLVTFVAAFGMEGFFQEGGTTGGWCWIRSGPYTEGVCVCQPAVAVLIPVVHLHTA